MIEANLKATLYQWLSKAMGAQKIVTITFNADLITGNVINGSFGGDAIEAVTFSGNHADTLLALAASIQKTDAIFKATITGARQITVVGNLNGDDFVVVGPTVTGGASQATAVVVETQEAEEVRVVFSDQAQPRLDYPYATIRLDSIQRNGWDEIRSIDPVTNIATIGGQRSATVSIQYFGLNPMEQISKAYNSLEKITVLDALSAGGIAIIQKNPIQNLTAMLETIFENRATFDFFIGYAENVEDDLGVIESAELSGEIQGNKTVVDVGPLTIET